jgi:hypothetical protein
MSLTRQKVVVASGGVRGGVAPGGPAHGAGALGLPLRADPRGCAPEARAFDSGRAAELMNHVPFLCEAASRGLLTAVPVPDSPARLEARCAREEACPTPVVRPCGKAACPHERAPAVLAALDTQAAVRALRALAERQGLALAAQLLADVGQALRPMSAPGDGVRPARPDAAAAVPNSWTPPEILSSR